MLFKQIYKAHNKTFVTTKAFISGDSFTYFHNSSWGFFGLEPTDDLTVFPVIQLQHH
jgi:hypothetical protein